MKFSRGYFGLVGCYVSAGSPSQTILLVNLIVEKTHQFFFLIPLKKYNLLGIRNIYLLNTYNRR